MTAQVVVDRSSPQLGIVSPAEGAVVGSLPLVVEGTVVDLTPTVVTVNGQTAAVINQVWQATLDALAEGPLSIVATATDAVPNPPSTRTRNVIVDLGAPTVSITSPASGVTREGSAVVTGSVSDAAVASVSVNGIPATLSGSSFTAADGRQLYSCLGGCAYSVVVALEPGDTTLKAEARDAFDREGASAPILVTRDSIPPQVSVEAPARLVKGQSGPAQAAATDNLAVARIVVHVNGVEIGSCEAASCEATITVPDGVANGSQLTVEAQAWDTAGNTTVSAPAYVQVGEIGAVVGQVLDDRTGWPLPQASVRLLSGDPEEPSAAVTTADDGRYSLRAENPSVTVQASHAGYVPVERTVQLVHSSGTVPVDARLTALPPAQTVAVGEVVAADASVNSYATTADGNARISSAVVRIAATAFAEGSFQLTPLSGQGLPNLLPLGWSPVVAFDLRGSDDEAPWSVKVSGAALTAAGADTGSRALRRHAAHLGRAGRRAAALERLGDLRPAQRGRLRPGDGRRRRPRGAGPSGGRAARRPRLGGHP